MNAPYSVPQEVPRPYEVRVPVPIDVPVPVKVSNFFSNMLGSKV